MPIRKEKYDNSVNNIFEILMLIFLNIGYKYGLIHCNQLSYIQLIQGLLCEIVTLLAVDTQNCNTMRSFDLGQCENILVCLICWLGLIDYKHFEVENNFKVFTLYFSA